MEKKLKTWLNCFKISGEGWCKVKGTSMGECIPYGSNALVKNRPVFVINRGDVVAFMSKDGIIIHRIISKFKWRGRTYFIHKGDDSYTTGVVSGTEILGKVTDVFTGEGERIDHNFIKKRIGILESKLTLLFSFLPHRLQPTLLRLLKLFK